MYCWIIHSVSNYERKWNICEQLHCTVILFRRKSQKSYFYFGDSNIFSRLPFHVSFFSLKNSVADRFESIWTLDIPKSRLYRKWPSLFMTYCTLYSTTRKLGCFVYTFLCVTDASSYACIVYLYTKILVNLKDGVLYSVQGLFAFLPFFPYNCILYGVLTLVCGYIHHFPIQKLTACN